MNGVGTDDQGDGGRVEIGPYTLVGRLGQGTLGTTYLALHRGQSRRLAIRILHRHLWEDAAAITFILDEARTANKMNHPNVVQTVDVGRLSNGVPYFVMEYASGPSLDVIAAAAGTGEDRVRYWCSILASVLSGLGHAHGVGIVHGAITSSDIRVTADGVPKLLGLEASLLRESLEDTFSPRMERQLRYAAPELLRMGGRASTASDVFSIAVCAWESLAGRPMYRGSSTAALMQHRMQGTILPLVEVVADVPQSVCHAIALAMSPEPLRRPTVQAFAAALRPSSSGVMQADIARWLERLFPVGEDDATRVIGATHDRSESRSLMGTPRSFGPPTPPSGSARPDWPVFPTPTSPTAAMERDPDELTTTPAVFLPPPPPLPEPTPSGTNRAGWLMLAAAVAVANAFAVVIALASVALWVAADMERELQASILQEARAALEADRPELALDLVGRLDTDDPEADRLGAEASHRLEIDRARVDVVRGRIDAAEARIQRVLREDPTDARALALQDEISASHQHQRGDLP